MNIRVKPTVSLLCGLLIAAVPVRAGLAQEAPQPLHPSAPANADHAVASQVRHEQIEHKHWKHEYASHHARHTPSHHRYRRHRHYVRHNDADLHGLANQSGGTQIVYGHAIDTQIGPGGRQVVLSNGTATNVQIAAGGTQSVAPGGFASNITVSGHGATQLVAANAQAVGGTLMNGGVQTVSGQAIDTKISPGGRQDIVAGGVSTDAAINGPGATQLVASNARAVASTLSNGGAQIVSGKAAGTKIGLGGRQTVSSGGVATNATVDGAGASQVVLPGGTAVNTNLTAAGTQTVYGTAIGTKLSCCQASQGRVAAPSRQVGEGHSAFLMWSLFSRIPVGQQIKGWGASAGWHVTWSGGVDPVVAKNLYYFGDFEKAARDAVADLNKQGAPIQAVFNDAAHILVLSNGPATK